MAKLNWKQQDHEVQESMFKDFPDGWYNFIITSCDCMTSQTTGEDQIEMDMTVMNGPMEGQSKRFWLSIYSANEVVNSIANSQFRQICEACGIVDLGDTDELLNKPVDMKLYTSKKGYQNIGEIKAANGSSTTMNSKPAGNGLPSAFQS